MHENYTLLIFEKAYMLHRHLFFAATAIVIITASCTDCKNTNNPQDGEIYSDTILSDSADSSPKELDLFGKRKIPTTADANFEDFLYAFLTDDEFAESRISDTITVDNGDSTTYLPKSSWNDMHLFKYQDLYTYIYTNDHEDELIKSPDLTTVAFEWLTLDSLHSDRYEFHHKDGRWQLDHIIRRHSIDKFENEFLTFYCQFVEDKEFQKQSLASPVQLIYGSDSEMNEGETYPLNENDWNEFRSNTPLPAKTIVLMDYGQHITPGTSINFIVRGITEAAYANYHFRRTRGHWMLYSVEVI